MLQRNYYETWIRRVVAANGRPTSFMGSVRDTLEPRLRVVNILKIFCSFRAFRCRQASGLPFTLRRRQFPIRLALLYDY